MLQPLMHSNKATTLQKGEPSNYTPAQVVGGMKGNSLVKGKIRMQKGTYKGEGKLGTFLRKLRLRRGTREKEIGFLHLKQQRKKFHSEKFHIEQEGGAISPCVSPQGPQVTPNARLPEVPPTVPVLKAPA